MREKEDVDPPKEKVDEEVVGKVIMESKTLEVLVKGHEEVNNIAFDEKTLQVVEPIDLSERTLELGESSGMVDEGEIIDIDGRYPFPFLQGIEDLLKTPMGNTVIEEVCGVWRKSARRFWKSRGMIWKRKRWFMCLVGVKIFLYCQDEGKNHCLYFSSRGR